MMTKDDKQFIYFLALEKAYNKRDKCQSDINHLEKEMMNVKKDEYTTLITYLERWRDDWQDVINNIQIWIKALE